MFREPIPFLCISLVLAASRCTFTPESVEFLEREQLPAVRAWAKAQQAACVGAGIDYVVDDWGGFDRDENVINAQVTCNLEGKRDWSAAILPALRAVPESGEAKKSRRIKIGKSKHSDVFPALEVARVPSFLVPVPNTIDLVVATGSKPAADRVEVVVVFKSPEN